MKKIDALILLLFVYALLTFQSQYNYLVFKNEQGLWIFLLAVFFVGMLVYFAISHKWIARFRAFLKKPALKNTDAVRGDDSEAASQSGDPKPQNGKLKTWIVTAFNQDKKKVILSGAVIVIVLWFSVLFGICTSPQYREVSLSEFFWGQVLEASLWTVLCILFSLYWIPVLFIWNRRRFTQPASRLERYSTVKSWLFSPAKKSLQPVKAVEFQSKREKYRIPLVGGIVGLPLTAQAVFHSHTWLTIFEQDTGNALGGAFVRCYILALIYAVVSFVSMIVVYRGADLKEIKEIRRTACLTCFLLCPAVYFAPMFLYVLVSGPGYGAADYVLGGIVVAPLLVIANALTFFILISLWHSVISIRRKSSEADRVPGNADPIEWDDEYDWDDDDDDIDPKR